VQCLNIRFGMDERLGIDERVAVQPAELRAQSQLAGVAS
jgi:hypothetical protein